MIERRKEQEPILFKDRRNADSRMGTTIRVLIAYKEQPLKRKNFKAIVQGLILKGILISERTVRRIVARNL